MSYKYKILLSVAPAVLALDQLTKFFVLRGMPLGQVIPVIPGFFDLVHIRNTGAAFGILAHWAPVFRLPFFYGVTIVAMVILIYAFKHLADHDRFYAVPLSLITGGVFGNLIDRARFGNVVDFLSFHVKDVVLWRVRMEWPAFNVADSAITVSVVLIAWRMLRGK